MKLLLPAFLVFFSISISFSQNNEWSKNNRNEIFEESMSSLIKYKNLSQTQRESISLCYLNDITSAFTKNEYNAKIDIELKRIWQSTVKQCSENLGLPLNDTVEEKETEKKEKKSKSAINEFNFTINDIVGTWRDHNGKMHFDKDGTFIFRWTSGKVVNGTWWLDESKSIVLSNLKNMRIISITENSFKYEQGRNYISSATREE